MRRSLWVCFNSGDTLIRGPPWGHRAQLPGIAFGSLCVCTPTSPSRSVQITNPLCAPAPRLKSTGADSPLTSVNQQNSPDTECLAHRRGFGWCRWWWCWWQWLLKYSHGDETVMSWLWYDGDRQPWWGWGEDGNDDGDNSSDSGDVAWWYDGDTNMILFILLWWWWYMI